MPVMMVGAVILPLSMRMSAFSKAVIADSFWSSLGLSLFAYFGTCNLSYKVQINLEKHNV